MTTLRRRLGRFALILLGPVLLAGCGYNTIPTKDEQVKAQWAEVQNQYQRRADLVPNLVSTVSGFADQERQVLTEVTQARAAATQTQIDASTITDPQAFREFQQAQDRLSGALGRLMVVVERYPELRSNQNFLALQSQLEGTENRIAIARRDYNDAVRDFNTEVRTLPGAIWAATVHGWAEPRPTFSASTEAQTAPRVDFGRDGASAPASAPISPPPPAEAPAADPAP